MPVGMAENNFCDSCSKIPYFWMLENILTISGSYDLWALPHIYKSHPRALQTFFIDSDFKVDHVGDGVVVNSFLSGLLAVTWKAHGCMVLMASGGHHTLLCQKKLEVFSRESHAMKFRSNDQRCPRPAPGSIPLLSHSSLLDGRF